MAEESLPGWSARIYQGIAEPLLIAGVPPLFLVLDFLGTLLLTFVQWRALVVGTGLYFAGAALTAWEPHWWTMLRTYWRYATYYEG